jgi:hypothetical protein
LRVPARFSVIAGLSLAILAGFGMRRWLLRLSPGGATAAFVAVVLLLAVDLRPNLTLEPVWREPPSVYSSLDPSSTVLAEFPIPHDPYEFAFNTSYMYFSIWHGANMVNGYSGFLPPSYAELAKGLANFPDDRSVALLRERGVTHVSLNCTLYRDDCSPRLSAFDNHPALRRLTDGTWQGAPVVIYQLLR